MYAWIRLQSKILHWNLLMLLLGLLEVLLKDLSMREILESDLDWEYFWHRAKRSSEQRRMGETQYLGGYKSMKWILYMHKFLSLVKRML